MPMHCTLILTNGAKKPKLFLKADIFYQTSKEPRHLIYYKCLCKYQLKWTRRRLVLVITVILSKLKESEEDTEEGGGGKQAAELEISTLHKAYFTHAFYC